VDAVVRLGAECDAVQQALRSRRSTASDDFVETQSLSADTWQQVIGRHRGSTARLHRPQTPTTR